MSAPSSIAERLTLVATLANAVCCIDPSANSIGLDSPVKTNCPVVTVLAKLEIRFVTDNSKTPSAAIRALASVSILLCNVASALALALASVSILLCSVASAAILALASVLILFCNVNSAAVARSVSAANAEFAFELNEFNAVIMLESEDWKAVTISVKLSSDVGSTLLMILSI